LDAVIQRLEAQQSTGKTKPAASKG
jgi:hypothetical protein